MNLKKLLDKEERGVSPVIGVILMVAITVILAAVIGAFVLGLGDQVSNNAPQATFEWTFENSSNATITHGGGEELSQDEIEVRIAGDVAYPDTAGSNGNSSGWDDSDGGITTGEEVEIYENGGTTFSGETVRIVWINPSGGSSNVIGERDWPN